MNYNRHNIEKRMERFKSPTTRITHKLVVIFSRILFLLVVFIILAFASAGFGIANSLIETAPSLDKIDVVPSGYTTKIVNSEDKTVHTLVGSNANREYVTLNKIPKNLQNAFVSIEDERFWTHDGVDVRGVIRSISLGLKGDFSQGASTLTQQLIKNQVFNGGEETTLVAKAKRKIQEQYLAIQLENRVSKNNILEYYLNTINLGQNTLGVQAASKRYFGKTVSTLKLSECAVLAGITQNPSAYNPLSHPEKNKTKQHTILAYMKDQGYITTSEYELALKDNVYKRIKLVNEKKQQSAQTVSTYYTDALINQVLTDLKEELGYTETQAYNALYRGGLTIYNAQDAKMQKICDTIINNEKYYPANSKFQLSYKLSIRDKSGTETHYSENSIKKFFAKKHKKFSLYYTRTSKADKYIKEFRKSVVKKDVTVTGEVTSYIPQPQVSFVLIDQKTGQVKAICGGRGDKMANRTLNRATDSLRQPGSTFKVVSTFAPALDTAGMTLASVQDDAPYKYPGTERAVKNWYKTGYRGLSSIRTAIRDSMNIVAVKTLDTITPRTAYDYLLTMGFTSLVEQKTDNNGKMYTDIALPMALGGLTKGVNNLELTNSFATIANGGIYNEPSFYTKILDHDGNVLLERKQENKQIMKDSTAWLLTDAMKDVITKGTGTMCRLPNCKTTVAGKSGTTTGSKDLWFVGYTPYLTGGIWGGYDGNAKQTNTTYHKIMWRTIMNKLNKKYKKTTFKKPDSITSAKICTKCGKLAVGGLCNVAVGGSCVKKEYFAVGSVPTESCDCHVKCRICSASGKLASDNCPATSIFTRVYLQKTETGQTADTPFVLPSSLSGGTCNVH